MRMSALLGAALFDRQVARRHTEHPASGEHVDSNRSSGGDGVALGPPPVVRDALAAAAQMLTLVRASGDAAADVALQTRVAELLADVATDADASGRELLCRLAARGLADALLQFLASVRPTDEALLQKIVRAVEALVALAAADDAEQTNRPLDISLDTLGAALGHLLSAQALRFTDLLRVGDLLCRAQHQQHFAVSRVGSAVQAGDASAASSLATGLRGFLRLLSPEMPSSIKQFSLWALASMLRAVEQLPHGAQAELVEEFLSPSCAALLLALPRGNAPLQLHAASFLDVALHLAQQHPSLVPPLTYERWMQQIRHGMAGSSSPSSAALQLASAQCVRTLSSSPRGRLLMSESAPTMEALYALARRLHDSVAQASDRRDGPSAGPRRLGRAKLKLTRGSPATAAAAPLPLALSDALAMQRHVSRAVRNICTSSRDGAAALTSSSSSSSSSLLLHSKRTLPMSRVFRGAQDLSDLPVVGAEEYESSTEIGWIDILTSWAGSSRREVRRNAIESLVHLAGADESGGGGGDAGARATQDLIVQAWLTRMLQHVRHLSGGGEILAVKQVEEIAQLADGLTPGNEKVLFNPAVVHAGAEALAVLAENHHEELLEQGVVPLMALLAESRHSSDALDLQTQSTRVLANLAAASCSLLSSYYATSSRDADSDELAGAELSTEAARRAAWQQFVADTFDVERLLQQTPSGKRLLRELRRWGQWGDPMRRSSYFRAAQNMAAYGALVASGRLDEDVYCEGVHPIVPFCHTTATTTAATATTTGLLVGTDVREHSSVGRARPALDVVFVHGLRGHPFGTWRTDMGRSVAGANDVWPDVLLAGDLARSGVAARLVTLGYEAGMVSWSSPWPSLTLEERGKVMLDALYAANIGRRKRAGERAAPVVFVTHSMGGILVKKMLLLAREQQPARGDNLAASTAGVVFLAVPHFGSDLANSVRSEAVRSLIQAHPAIRDLCADPDGRLVALNDAFRALGIGCMSIGEAKPAPLGLGLSAVVVKPESADPGFGSFHVLPDADHMTICKARSADEPHYRAILRYLLACCGREDAPPAA